MKRTAKDVVDEWRNSVVNNDDGELVSRINYWAVTDFCPSFAPHPGLGSGALREALEQRIKECRETAERWEAESRNVRIDRAIHKDYSLALHALANLLERALSLSSSIEHDKREALATYLLNISAPDWEYDKVISMAAEVLAQPTSQASSGIRERALIAKWRKKAEDIKDHEVTLSELISGTTVYILRLCADELERALPPSRQGAAKSVEG